MRILNLALRLIPEWSVFGGAAIALAATGHLILALILRAWQRRTAWPCTCCTPTRRAPPTDAASALNVLQHWGLVSGSRTGRVELAGAAVTEAGSSMAESGGTALAAFLRATVPQIAGAVGVPGS